MESSPEPPLISGMRKKAIKGPTWSFAVFKTGAQNGSSLSEAADKFLAAFQVQGLLKTEPRLH